MASSEPAAYVPTAAPPLVDSTADRVRPSARALGISALMPLVGFVAAIFLPVSRDRTAGTR